MCCHEELGNQIFAEVKRKVKSDYMRYRCSADLSDSGRFCLHGMKSEEKGVRKLCDSLSEQEPGI